MARLAIRVDVDTWDGAREGIPSLLRVLDRTRARASFFVSVGPDRWGRAALRAFTRPGFVAKMRRTRGLYPWKTMLRGTLLPARDFRDLAPLLRSIEAAGHEVALHAWDHVRWQDRLLSLSRDEVAAELARAVEAFAAIFGREPRAIAAPGWVASEDHLLAQETYGLDYASDVRGDAPFVPLVRSRELTVQVPTTLPTADELIGRDGVTAATLADALHRRMRERDEVLVVHTELEGRSLSRAFEDLLARALSSGRRLVALEDLARALDRTSLPRAAIALEAVPGRSGTVAVARALP